MLYTLGVAQLIELDTTYELNSKGSLDDPPDYLRIDNTELSAAEVAERIIERFVLRRLAATQPGA